MAGVPDGIDNTIIQAGLEQWMLKGLVLQPLDPQSKNDTGFRGRQNPFTLLVRELSAL